MCCNPNDELRPRLAFQRREQVAHAPLRRVLASERMSERRSCERSSPRLNGVTLGLRAQSVLAAQQAVPLSALRHWQLDLGRCVHLSLPGHPHDAHGSRRALTVRTGCALASPPRQRRRLMASRRLDRLSRLCSLTLPGHPHDAHGSVLGSPNVFTSLPSGLPRADCKQKAGCRV